VANLSRKPALVFIGFMGAGKTTALAAAREAGLQTTEVDDLIERELGAPIGEFFDREGEAEFRRREAEVVVPLLEQADGGAIALGGGSVLSEGAPEALRRHLVVWLQVEVEEAWRRAEGTGRPLARDRAAFEALMPIRQPLYEQLADAILPGADREEAARAMPWLQAMVGSLPDGTRMVWAATASGGYPIFVGRGLIGAKWPPTEGRPYGISDRTVAELYLGAHGFEKLLLVEPGERSKSLAEAERLLGELADAGMTRSDHIVAFGGGVVGDLAGFCAATYQRGVALSQVPTTLVAQVDSAIGGKTGVDLPQAKNYIGAYHQPMAVIADVNALSTLPGVELAAGWVEVIKTALLAGGALWERVRGANGPDLEGIDRIVFECARFKAEVVAADERDSGRRAILNLGHTVGHAIEAATGYERYRHGEAVGLGLLAALRISEADELRAEVLEILEAAKLPTRIEEAGAEEIYEALQRDKKRDAEGVRFVLLSEPGHPREGQLVEADRVREAIVELVG
jgi:shikimate kinase / 3-dehydroquinate synthase